MIFIRCYYQCSLIQDLNTRRVHYLDTIFYLYWNAIGLLLNSVLIWALTCKYNKMEFKRRHYIVKTFKENRCLHYCAELSFDLIPKDGYAVTNQWIFWYSLNPHYPTFMYHKSLCTEYVIYDKVNNVERIVFCKIMTLLYQTSLFKLANGAYIITLDYKHLLFIHTECYTFNYKDHLDPG